MNRKPKSYGLGPVAELTEAARSNLDKHVSEGFLTNSRTRVRFPAAPLNTKPNYLYMRDFSKCPSCGAAGSIHKDGFYRYKHGANCKMGDFKQKGMVCSACGAKHSFGTYRDESLPNPGDDRWLAPDECPLCWVIAESCLARK